MKIKKSFVIYCAVWASLFALFNALIFLMPSISGQDNFTSSFWIGYSFITLAFVGQFICSYLSFKDGNTGKIFCGISLITASYIGLATTYIISLVCMALPIIPDRLGVIGCIAVLVMNMIAVAFSADDTDRKSNH